jgi:hypothetical protein
VIDFPWFQKRFVGGKGSKQYGYQREQDSMLWLSESRINGLFIEHYNHNLAWWQLDPLFRSAADSLGEAALKYGLVDLGLQVNPYVHLNNSELGDDLRISDPRTIESILKIFNAFYKAGARHLMLRADDFVPKEKGTHFGYQLTDPEDKSRFGSLAAAHAFLIDKVLEGLKRKDSEPEISFVPPWYTNRFVMLSKGLAEKYYDQLSSHVPGKISFGWTGPTVRSLSVNSAHISFWRSLVGKRPLFFWDNTPYARRHRHYWGESEKRAGLASFFEPYSVQFSDLSQVSRDEMFFLNSNINPHNKIQIATFGDFLWNPGGYHPERSLVSFLKINYGLEAARLLIDCDSLLWSIRRDKAESAEKSAFKRKSLTRRRGIKINRLKKMVKKLERLSEDDNRDIVDSFRGWIKKEESELGASW